jgi:hypothetical protein
VVLAAACLTTLPPVLHAAPLSLDLGFGSGIGYARLASLYRDDNTLSVRLGIAPWRRVSIDLGFSEDLERIEAAFHTGVRVRPLRPSRRWSPVLRGDIALVGASHFGSNVDLTVGVGHWGRLAPDRFPWVAWFVDLDTVVRVGEVSTLSERLEVGLAFTTRSFWR